MMACALDPRYKSLLPSRRESVHDELVRLMDDVQDDAGAVGQSQQTQQTAQEEPPPTTQPVKMQLMECLRGDIRDEAEVARTSVELELENYLTEPVIYEEPLMWWSANAKSSQGLSRLQSVISACQPQKCFHNEPFLWLATQ